MQTNVLHGSGTCRDVNADDYIGTFYLHMSEISSLADNGIMIDMCTYLS